MTLNFCNKKIFNFHSRCDCENIKCNHSCLPINFTLQILQNNRLTGSINSIYTYCSTHPVRIKTRGRPGFSCCAILASSTAPAERRRRVYHTFVQPVSLINLIGNVLFCSLDHKHHLNIWGKIPNYTLLYNTNTTLLWQFNTVFKRIDRHLYFLQTCTIMYIHSKCLCYNHRN